MHYTEHNNNMKNWYVATPITQVGLLVVLFCWATGSVVAAFSLEEEFQHLKENYIQMQDTVKSLELKVSQLKSLESKATQLESKVTQLESQVIRLKTKDDQMQEKVTELEAKVQQQDSLLTSLLREKNDRTAAAGFDSIPVSTNQSHQSAVAINGLPASCSDLKVIGHIWSGIYSVMGSSMMESVYCDFTKLPSAPGFQQWIGYTDVKSAPAHFYVQRQSPFSTLSTPIPFELEPLNEGNAMDISSGIFTAPQPGIYYFSFTGMASFPSSSSRVFMGIFLYLNGGLIGTGYVSEANTIENQWSPLTLQSTLKLGKGDQVWLAIFGMSADTYLFDGGGHYNHFNGFIMQEEIVASL